MKAVTYGGPGTSEEVVENSNLMTEQHQSIDQVRSNETSSTSDYQSARTLLDLFQQELTQDPLSFRVGQKLDGRELGNGSVLDRVGFLVVDRLGSEIFLLRTNVDSLTTSLDVAGGLER